jgi:5-methyltetrahydrofolate--homocysteine methyltransferase
MNPENHPMQTILKSEQKTVVIDSEGPFVMIGEKINPTGRKKMAAALQASDFDYIHRLAKSQIAAGAEVLDVNVGVPGLDDVELMKIVVQYLAQRVDVPLCLDSSNPATLVAGLAVAPGKPLVNSINGEESRLVNLLPVVKDRGAAVIGLLMDDNGIPATPSGRLTVAEKILERAVRIGIPQEDVIIDPLVMSVGADSTAGSVTLETIRLVREKLGLNINLGASNVSFGMPDRPTINMTFLAMTIGMGASCAITDPLKMSGVIRAADLLLGRDEYGMRYIKSYRKTQALLNDLASVEQKAD